jgi:hypothetical protein
LNSLARLTKSLKAKELVIGVAPVDYGSALDTCLSSVTTGFTTIMFEEDEWRVDEYNDSHNPFGVPMPMSLRRSKKFSVDVYGSKVGLTHVVFVCGDYFGLDRKEQKEYREALQRVGQWIPAGSGVLVVCLGRFEPGFIEFVAQPELSLGGMLKMQYDYRLALVTPYALRGGLAVTGDSETTAQFAADLVDDIGLADDVSQGGHSEIECLPVIEAAYTAANTMMLTEMRMMLAHMRHNATAALEFAELPLAEGIEPSFVAADEQERRALRYLLSHVGQVPKEMMARTMISNALPAHVTDRLSSELVNRDVVVQNASVVVVGDSRDPDTDEPSSWREQPLWRALERMKFHELHYYDVRRATNAEMRAQPLNMANIKEDGYDAAVIVTNHDSTKYDLIAKAVPLTLDCCGACSPDINGVVQV